MREKPNVFNIIALFSTVLVCFIWWLGFLAHLAKYVLVKNVSLEIYRSLSSLLVWSWYHKRFYLTWVSLPKLGILDELMLDFKMINLALWCVFMCTRIGTNKYICISFGLTMTFTEKKIQNVDVCTTSITEREIPVKSYLLSFLGPLKSQIGS